VNHEEEDKAESGREDGRRREKREREVKAEGAKGNKVRS